MVSYRIVVICSCCSKVGVKLVSCVTAGFFDRLKKSLAEENHESFGDADDVGVDAFRTNQ